MNVQGSVAAGAGIAFYLTTFWVSIKTWVSAFHSEAIASAKSTSMGAGGGETGGSGLNRNALDPKARVEQVGQNDQQDFEINIWKIFTRRLGLFRIVETNERLNPRTEVISVPTTLQSSADQRIELKHTFDVTITIQPFVDADNVEIWVNGVQVMDQSYVCDRNDPTCSFQFQFTGNNQNIYIQTSSTDPTPAFTVIVTDNPQTPLRKRVMKIKFLGLITVKRLEIIEIDNDGRGDRVTRRRTYKQAKKLILQ